jgi:hypothetical protein
MTIPNWLKVLLTFLSGVAATLAAIFLFRPKPPAESPAKPIVDAGNAEKAKVAEQVAKDTSQELADEFNKGVKP